MTGPPTPTQRRPATVMLPALRWLVVLAVALAAASCRVADEPSPPDGGAPAGQPADSGEPPQPDPPDPETPPPAGTRLDDVAVTLRTVVRASSPTAMAARDGDDALYIAERSGRVRVLRGGSLQDTPLIDLHDETTTDGERGLLGLTFAPDGQTLYVSLTDRAGDSLLLAYAMDGDRVDEETRREILSVEQPFSNHNGGGVAFGPDGYLYYGLGDGGGAGDPHGTGQDPASLLGSLLRVDPAGTADGYAVPADNPFVGDQRGRDEVWAYGLRNPWRFTFDSATGDLWIADVGQNEVEEINVIPAGEGGGANYGWSSMEGTRDFDGRGEPPGHVPPVVEYANSGERCSITGGVVYRGQAIAGLEGAYLYSDLCDGVVRAVVVSDGAVVAERDLGVALDQVVSFGQDSAGEVYVVSLSGEIARLEPAG